MYVLLYVNPTSEEMKPHIIITMYVLLSLSLSCSRSIFPSHSHCIIIHWQVEPSTTNLLLSCFSLNIRSKYRVTKFNRGVASDLLCRLTFLICRFVELDDISRSFHWFHSVGVQSCLLYTNWQKMCWCVHLCQSNLHVFKAVTAETATFLAQANLLGQEISSPAILDPDFASVEEKRWMETMHFLLSLKTNMKLHYSVTQTWYRYMPQK